MGDTRTDSGQFYPGGKVIPRQPVRPGGGSDADAVHYYAETRNAAEKAQARTNIDALGSGDSIPQSHVDGLADALAKKRDNTDLAVYEYSILTPGRFGKDFVFAPGESGYRLAWRIGEFDDPQWAMIYYSDEYGNWTYTGSDDEYAIAGSPDDLVLSFAHIGTFTRSPDPNAGSLATTRQLPAASQLLTPAQAAEIAKVEDKRDIDDFLIRPIIYWFAENKPLPFRPAVAIDVVVSVADGVWVLNAPTGVVAISTTPATDYPEAIEFSNYNPAIFSSAPTASRIVESQVILKSGLDSNGVPLDPKAVELFSKSDTFATDKHLNNSVLEESVNALIDAKIGSIDDALDALNGEVA